MVIMCLVVSKSLTSMLVFEKVSSKVIVFYRVNNNKIYIVD